MWNTIKFHSFWSFHCHDVNPPLHIDFVPQQASRWDFRLAAGLWALEPGDCYLWSSGIRNSVVLRQHCARRGQTVGSDVDEFYQNRFGVDHGLTKSISSCKRGGWLLNVFYGRRACCFVGHLSHMCCACVKLWNTVVVRVVTCAMLCEAWNSIDIA